MLFFWVPSLIKVEETVVVKGITDIADLVGVPMGHLGLPADGLPPRVSAAMAVLLLGLLLMVVVVPVVMVMMVTAMRVLLLLFRVVVVWLLFVMMVPSVMVSLLSSLMVSGTRAGPLGFPIIPGS